MTPAERTAPPPVALQRTTVRSIVLWSAALFPFLALALWRFQDGPGLSADDYGQYLMHARALAEGRAYTDIGYIYSPFRWGIGPAAAPPGLPVTLAVVYALFGPDLAVMRVLMLVFATTFVAVAGLYFARHDDRRLGVGVALLCGLSPAVTHSSTQLLTDLPFAALIWLVIYVADRPGDFTMRRVTAITVIGAAAIAFRLFGVALIPALLLFTVLRRRTHGLRPALPVLIWTLTGALLLLVLPMENVSVLKLQRILEWRWTDLSTNLVGYWPVVFESHTHPFPWPLVNDVFHIITGIVMVIGLAAWVPRAVTRFGVLFALIYAAMVLFLPITNERYLWVLFPFLVFGLLNGVRVIVSRMPAYAARAHTAALIFALLLVPPAIAKGSAAPPHGDLMRLPEVQRVVHELKRASRGTQPRVVFYKPRAFAWTTGIPAMAQIGGPPQCLIAELARGRISHVIAGSVTSGSTPVQQRDLTRLERQRPDIFHDIFRSEHFILYHVVLSPAEAAAARTLCNE